MTQPLPSAPVSGPTFDQPNRTATTENFPVGSWLLPAELRPAVAAYYRVARAADDIADTPALESQEKVRQLDALDAVLAGASDGGDDPAHEQARRLRVVFAERGLLIEHSRHLLQAFRADAINRPCRSWSDLLAYCRYSAAPVGRFLLDLHGESRDTWKAGDALCAALQILNHLQDCQGDWRELQRLYVPLDWLTEAGLSTDDLLASHSSPAMRGVLDRALDGVDRLNVTAATLPVQIAHRSLRMEVSAILAISRRLARRLRKRDPIAGRVELSKLEKLGCMLYGAARGYWR
jgi:squalene synthase HpnC